MALFGEMSFFTFLTVFEGVGDDVLVKTIEIIETN